MGFSRQEYWNGLPFPSPGDLPDPEIELRPPALQADTLPSELPGKPQLRPKSNRKKKKKRPFPHPHPQGDSALTQSQGHFSQEESPSNSKHRTALTPWIPESLFCLRGQVGWFHGTPHPLKKKPTLSILTSVSPTTRFPRHTRHVFGQSLPSRNQASKWTTTQPGHRAWTQSRAM